MKTTELLDLARVAARVATQAGAKDARAKVTRSREVAVEWRDGKVDRIQESTSQRLSVALFVDGRFSGNATSDLRQTAIEDFVKSGVAATRLLAKDEHRHLPDPGRYQGMFTGNLETVDAKLAETTPEARLSVAKQLEEAARSGPGSERVISVTSWVDDTQTQSVCFNTNGFDGQDEGTFTSQGVEVSVKDEGDRKPEGYAYGSCRNASDLPSIVALGAEALSRALAQLASRQVATGRYELVIENRAVPTFARHLVQPLSGGAVQQKRSFLDGMLGKPFASPLLSITDEPHLRRGLASTAWDAEGMATQSRALVEKGVLRNYFLDTYYGSKLGMQPTCGSPTNMVWSSGKRDKAAMVAAMKRGLLVTDFLGGNSNPTTGDFSLGIRGFWVEKGKLVHPVSEMNIAGNHLAFWKQLAEVGSDPWLYSGNRAPSLRFTDVQCSGAAAK